MLPFRGDRARAVSDRGRARRGRAGGGRGRGAARPARRARTGTGGGGRAAAPDGARRRSAHMPAPRRGRAVYDLPVAPVRPSHLLLRARAGALPRARALTAFVAARFGDEIARFGIAIAAAAAAIGAALGIVAWGLVALRDRASRRAPRSAGSLAAASLACVAALHALAMLWAMAARPQL